MPKITLNISEEKKISINKFISETGFCSRREADKLILSGRVTIDGSAAKSGNRVTREQVVTIDGDLLKIKEKAVYIAFNKPYGISSTTDLKDKSNIIKFIAHPTRIFPIGRLDKDSEGLILLTNDGDIVNKVLRAGNNHEKEYIVTVDKPITQDFVKKMSGGITILGKITKTCFVKQEQRNIFRIILVQGLNRQIRRMCLVLGYQVKRLVRIRIMNITLKDISPGHWRDLSTEEILKLNELTRFSIKTSHH